MKKHLLFFLISISFTIQSVSQCSINTNPTNDCSWGDQINAFTLNAISPGGANSGCGANGYNAFNTPVWNLTQGFTYTGSAIVGSNTYNQGFSIWIDLNKLTLILLSFGFEASQCSLQIRLIIVVILASLNVFIIILKI